MKASNRRLVAAAVVAGFGSIASAQQLGKVFYIELENHNFTQPDGNINTSSSTIEQLKNNPAAPYLNSLITFGNPNATHVSYASDYLNVLPGSGQHIHPSEPNYVWQEGGSNYGIGGDADPGTGSGATYPQGNNLNKPSLSGLLQSKGIGWKSYMEGIDHSSSPTTVNPNQPSTNGLTSALAPQSQWTVPLHSFSGTSASYTNPYNGSHQYNLAPKHAGQLFFQATNGNLDNTSSNPEVSHYSPLEQLSTDLTNNTVAPYTVITPDQYNDMHTALTGGFTYNGTHYTGDAAEIAQGDNFLSMIIPQIMASAAYQNNGAIVIWNDETEASAGTANPDAGGTTSTEIVISNLAKGNAYNSTLPYTHSSDLKTLEELYGVGGPGSYLNDANNAYDLRDLFSSPSAIPEPGSMALLGFGSLSLLGRRRRV